MEALKAILGLPVISVKEGAELGKIRDFLIDSDKRHITYLLIDDGKWYKGAKVLLYTDIIAIGTDAITIKSTFNVHYFLDVEEAQVLADKGINIANTKAYTERGICLGNIQEFYIDIDTGAIVGCQLEDIKDTKENCIIPISKVMTFGKNIIIVADDIENIVPPMSRTVGLIENIKVPHTDNFEDDLGIKNDVNFKDNIYKAKDNNQEVPDMENKASSLFEKRQLKFLLGRKASKEIFSDNGILLVEVGQEITDDVLDIIKANNKLTELTMNTQA